MGRSSYAAVGVSFEGSLFEGRGVVSSTMVDTQTLLTRGRHVHCSWHDCWTWRCRSQRKGGDCE